MDKRIFVAHPTLTGNERRYVLDCLDSNWVSSKGEYIDKFESAFARFCNVKHAIATPSGTSALHLALIALGLGPGDEVIVPTVTFIATANAVRYCGATPVLVDVCPQTLSLDPQDFRKRLTPNTKAVIPVHLYGQPAEMDEILAIARAFDIAVVEDAAEAHGAEYRGQRVGGLGDCGIFSFYANKIITTGEGGMLTTNDTSLAERVRVLRAHGMDPSKRYWFPLVGYNYKMTNIAAALGLAQLEQIDAFLSSRNCLATKYHQVLAPLADELVLPEYPSGTAAVNWMFTIYLRHRSLAQRDAVIELLAREGIETRPVFHPLHTLPPYYDARGGYPIADEWTQRGLCLPTHLMLTDEQLERIAKVLAAALEQLPPRSSTCVIDGDLSLTAVN